MFKELKNINKRPEPYQCYTASDLWTNKHTSKKMLEYHLNEEVEAASRKKSFIEQSVKWIASHFNVGNDTMIADFGCGPGLYTTMLAEKGARVTGIDFSKNSLDYAKQVAATNGLDIKYVLDNYLEFEIDYQFDLILMIMCDFCALSPEQRRIMLTKFHRLLKPSGSILLDVYSLNSFKQKEEAATYKFNQLDGFWSPDDYYCFVNTFKYEKEKVILDKYVILERTQIREVYNWLQFYNQDSLRDEIESHGFKIENVYSNVAGKIFDVESNEFAIVASRK